jgi:hypothetical protein
MDMQPKTVETIRRTLAERKHRQPTSDELLRDAERLFLALLHGTDYDFSWFDVRDWLRSYQGYRITKLDRVKLVAEAQKWARNKNKR